MTPERRFAFRLALALGVWDIDALYDAMPGSVFGQWLAYDQIEPVGNVMTDVLLAQLNATMVNVYRDPKKSKPVTAGAFLPQLQAQPQSSQREQRAARWQWFKTWAMLHNARVKNA